MKSPFNQQKRDRTDFSLSRKEYNSSGYTSLPEKKYKFARTYSLKRSVIRSGMVASLVSTLLLGTSGNVAIAAGGCPAGQAPFSSAGNADSQTSSALTVQNGNNVLGSPDTNIATLRSIGRITLDLTDLIPENATVSITLARATTNGSVRIEASTDGTNFSGATTYGASGDIIAGPVNTLETISYTVPAGGARYIRLQGLSFTSQIIIDAASYSTICADSVDYGDAPAVYGTLEADNGPSHKIVSGLRLGSLVDADTDGFGDGVETNGNAADDSPGDDGISSFPRIYDDTFDDVHIYSVNANVTNTTGSNANLVGWIDFDRNNQFDSNESVNVSVPNGTNAENITLVFDVPNDIQAGTTYARLRLTTDAIDGNNPLGGASDGEVEDYVMTISSALPLPTNLACGNPANFPWEGDPGGFIWNVNDTNNTYSIPGIYDVNITLLDPDNQNLDTGNQGTFSPPGYTESAGVFGAGRLTWSMTSDNDAQTVTMQITFSEPTVLNDMVIVDIDGIQGDFFDPVGYSFQDEVMTSASFRGSNVPMSFAPVEAGIMTITGQTARGGYSTFGTSLTASDPRGHLQLSTTAPIDTLILQYSNGPADGAADGGISDDHSIAIDLWTFCEAFPEIRGTVWDDDLDGDGIRDIGESGIGGVGVELYDVADRNNPIATPIAVTTTSGDGTYNFTNQIPGDYFIRFIPLVDKGFTGTDQGGDDTQDSDADTNGETADFTLVSGVDQENLDAGLITTITTSAPDVLLVKRVTAINGDRTENPNDNTPLNAITTDDGATNDENTRWPGGYLVGETDAGLVKPGDEIEYTIYFLNAGNTDAADVRICDLIQPNQSFVLDAYGAGTVVDGTGSDLQLQLGTNSAVNLTTANDANDRTQLITSGATVPTDRDCNLKGANTDGVVVIDLTGAGGTGIPALPALPASTDTTTPNDAYGLIRFTTKVDE